MHIKVQVIDRIILGALGHWLSSETRVTSMKYLSEDLDSATSRFNGMFRGNLVK